MQCKDMCKFEEILMFPGPFIHNTELPEGRGGQPQEAEKLLLALDEMKQNLM